LCNNRLDPLEVTNLKTLVDERQCENISVDETSTEQKKGDVLKPRKTILFDNLLKPKPLFGYGGF
jgi:hypothetical protein